MIGAYSDIRAFVQHLTPTWRKTQHTNLALLVQALLARPSLYLSELARGLPAPEQPLHGRLKRLARFLDNPRLDEGVLFWRFLKLAYRFGDDLPDLPPEGQSVAQPEAQRQIVPLLLDTTYFEPFALLVVAVPCGSRALPIVQTTYHRTELRACFPPKPTWPSGSADPLPPRQQRHATTPPASAEVGEFLSQNLIEERLVDYAYHLLSPALKGVLVADRGFARASLLRRLLEQKRDFAIRFDAQTHVRLPEPLAPDLPRQGLPAEVLGLRPGGRVWCEHAFYSKEDEVPLSLFALWEPGYKEPWYIATSLKCPQTVETLYRWRMRIECANRDEKSGVLLRESGDKHKMTSLLHLHRLLLALAVAEWLCALVGLQAHTDLPETEPETSAAILSDTSASKDPISSQAQRSEAPRPFIPEWANDYSLGRSGPAAPPPVVPHRGARSKPAPWTKPFTAWGPLSYVRLGLEILRSPSFLHVIHNTARWLGYYLWFWTPLWRYGQRRYRFLHWWPTPA